MIGLGILGPLEVRRDGETVELRAAKERALLVLLSLHLGEVVPRDRLVGALWGESPPETAGHALEVYVSNLRRALGRDVIETRGGGYALAIDPDHVDAAQFEGLVDRARGQLQADAAAAADTLRDALGLWRGPALVDVAYEDFAQMEIGRLEELRVVALEERFEADLRLGRHTEIVAELEALVREHPLRERLRAQLMLALYRSGRQADALEAFHAARETLLEEVGLEPNPELRELQAGMLRQDPMLQVEPEELRARRHLPRPATPFVGRRDELARLLERFRGDGARLLSLIGPGGSGKTRLALRAAHELASDYADGVYFVDLASVADAAVLEQTIATAVGLQDVTPLAEHLARRRVLLVLDNFEQLDAAAPSVGELLRLAPQLSLLVTSRRPLHIYGEHVFTVPPLAPEDAVELFVARALAAGRELRPSGTVDDLCAWLDRLPLAIELVAARVRQMSPERLLSDLPSRLELAVGGPRDVPERQRTLRATIQWSYGLLSERERLVLARLGVFVGGFTPDSARTVCNTDLSDLAALAAASLLVERQAPEAEPRLALLESIRDYALERLDERGESDSIRERHARYFLDLAERAEPELERAGEEWLELLDADYDNLRAALDWIAVHDAREGELRLAVALRRFWLVRGHAAEGQRRLEEALARRDDQPAHLRARAAGAAGQLALVRGDYTTARERTEESLELARELGDERLVAISLNRLADIAKGEGEPDAADRHYASALDIARRIDDDRALAGILTNAGAFALLRGDVDKSEGLTHEALSRWEALDHTEGVAIALQNLAAAAVDRNAPTEALPYLERSIELSRRLSFTQNLAHGIGTCAIVAIRSGAPEEAAQLLAAVEMLLDSIGAGISPHLRTVQAEVTSAVEAALTPEHLAEAREKGSAMSLDEALACGLEAVRAAARKTSTSVASSNRPYGSIDSTATCSATYCRHLA